MSRAAAVAALLMAVLVLAGCAGEPAARSPGGTILFDGTSLAGWRVVEEGPFRRHGDVTLAGGAVRLAPGKPLTGIAWAGDVPRCGYEVSFEARRTAGSDFFCGLTFPVGNAHCTWIVGGWGGTVVGLSNVDGQSATENATTSRRIFETGRWYRLTLCVTDAAVVCCIDGEPVVEQPRHGHTFGIWPQQEPCRPLGIATYLTGSAVRRVRLEK